MSLKKAGKQLLVFARKECFHFMLDMELLGSLLHT
jgi:hypothetical protein